jgi:hypothetical protein
LGGHLFEHPLLGRVHELAGDELTDRADVDEMHRRVVDDGERQPPVAHPFGELPAGVVDLLAAHAARGCTIAGPSRRAS